MSVSEIALLTPLSYRGMVCPWHCDHNGHMNAMSYVGKFDEASSRFLAGLGLTPSYLRESGHGLVALRQELDYRREAVAGEVVEVSTRLLEATDMRLTLIHRMRKAHSGEEVAVCQLLMAHIDRHRRRSCAFPPDIAAVLSPRPPAP